MARVEQIEEALITLNIQKNAQTYDILITAFLQVHLVFHTIKKKNNLPSCRKGKKYL